MKSEILRALRESGGEFVSGQVLCEKAGVTRQAVWKNIVQLKDYGFVIESVTNKGYRLVSSPDKLYSADIKSRMKKDSFCQRIESYDTIDSTNTRAKHFAELGEDEGTLVIAEKQTSGKGRRGRQWESEPMTSVYMSIILRPKISPMCVPGITLLAALAVVRAVKEACNIQPLIKWPNDIILEKKKICGILTEMSSELDYINYAVVGIGINVNNKQFPTGIEDKATSIYLETGKKQDRAQLAALTAQYFGEYYKKFIEAKSLKPFTIEYNGLLVNKDKEVKILYGMQENAHADKIETGIARGINGDGALIVDTKNGTECVISGEVSVRGLYGYV